MKKQIALVLAFAAFLISACDDENAPRPTPLPQPTAIQEPIIRSFYPKAAPSGSTVVIFGENFGPALSDNYVSFGSSSAEIIYVSHGVLNVRVPELTDGDYEIKVQANGQVRRASQMFTVVSSQP
jgi:hypothetical protein